MPCAENFEPVSWAAERKVYSSTAAVEFSVCGNLACPPSKFRIGIIWIFTTGTEPPAFEAGFKGELTRKSARGHRKRVLRASDVIGDVLVSRLLNFSSEKSRLYKNSVAEGSSFGVYGFFHPSQIERCCAVHVEHSQFDSITRRRIAGRTHK